MHSHEERSVPGADETVNDAILSCYVYLYVCARKSEAYVLESVERTYDVCCFSDLCNVV